MKTFKRAIFKGGDRPLTLERAEIPEPGTGELVIRLKACGICGSDLHLAQVGGVEPGSVMGHEFSGEVAAVGPDPVGRWQVGDRVSAVPVISCGVCPNCIKGAVAKCAKFETVGLGGENGAYAEYMRVSSAHTFKLPDSISFSEAACIEPYAVGLHAVKLAKLKPGQSVLVVGAGPVGLTVAQWAKFFGAGRVVVSERVAQRLELSRQVGATDVIDASQEDDVPAAYRRLTGAPPDVIFEVVGVPGMIQRCIDMSGKGGRVVVVGVCMAPDTINPMKAIMREVELAFCYGYTNQEFAFTLDMMAAKRIDPKPIISHRISLEELPEAFQALHNPTDQSKVMVMY